MPPLPEGWGSLVPEFPVRLRDAATPQRQMSRGALSGRILLGQGAPGCGGYPGTAWHRRGACQLRASWRAGLSTLPSPPPPPPPNSPVKHPRGQVTAPPLSGVRVRRDKGSPVLGGEKSIRGERWCGAIRAEIPPQPQRQGEGRCVRTRPQSWGAARSPPVARGWPTVPPGSAPSGTPSRPSSPALI